MILSELKAGDLFVLLDYSPSVAEDIKKYYQDPYVFEVLEDLNTGNMIYSNNKYYILVAGLKHDSYQCCPSNIFDLASSIRVEKSKALQHYWYWLGMHRNVKRVKSILG